MWKIERGNCPLIAAAIHSGHKIRSELKKNLIVSTNDRAREEDRFTSKFTKISDNRIVVQTSRFEVDLNRTREKAFYLSPKDAWGLDIWKKLPNKKDISISISQYDRFYQEIKTYISELIKKFGKIVIFDIHSYNHRRNGPNEKPDDPQKNPEIIIGTSNMNIKKWENILKTLERSFKDLDYFDRKLNVRRNVKYPGGNFARWIHRNFPESVCVFSIEFKKIFMNEWTGELYSSSFQQLYSILEQTKKEVLSELWIL